MAYRVLVVDDEDGIRETLSQILEDEGLQTRTAGSITEARAALQQSRFDLVILDVWLPDGDGVDYLDELRKGAFQGPVVMISGHANIDSAVRALRLGAADFLEKPLSLSRVVLTVGNALERDRLERENRELAQRFSADHLLVGNSQSMNELKSKLEIAARSESRLLITGENGTGKELVARETHRLSNRAGQPFVAVNCAAIPEELIESELFGHLRGAFTGAARDRRGRFAQADKGTLFLDEIGDMSMRTQAKVLRVLEDQCFEPVGGTEQIQVDVRVIAATNKDLQHEIRAGRFRDDLFFRLAVIPLEVPPLRDRSGDITVLLEHFALRFASELGQAPKSFSPEALRQLESYHWPGNVRELRNLVERLLIMSTGDSIEENDLPTALRPHHTSSSLVDSVPLVTLKEAREAFEAEYIKLRLDEHRGNVSQTAKALGLERSHLYRKMKTHGLRPERTP